MAKQQSSGGKSGSTEATKQMPANQKAMKAKSRSSSDADADDEEEEDFDREPTIIEEWIRQSPSMLVSLVVHMLVFIGLAVYTFDVITKPANVVKLMPEEPEEEPKISEEVEIDPPDEVVNAPVPDEIIEPVPEVMEKADTDTMDPEAAAPLVENLEPSDFSIPVKVGTSKSSSGSGDVGLGARIGAKKGRGLRNGGGTPGSVNAVGAGLRWLAAHQNTNGSWSFNHTAGDKCSLFPNPGEKTSKMGATGLALLAFLGDGHTHNQDGPYKDTVFRGISYLMKKMAPSGKLYEDGGENQLHMYCHGIAACAMAEAYGLTRDNRLHDTAKKALDYIVKAQGEDGGWRYLPNEPGDTSAVGWQIMAFKSGKMSYLSVPEHVYPNAMKFLDSVQLGYGGKYKYMPATEFGDSEATSAIGLLCRTYMGWPREHKGLQEGVAFCSAKGPLPNNVYFNYYATMFMFQNDGPKGPAWSKWNEVMREHLINTQEKKGGIHRVGSWWFPNDNTHHEADAGGRLYHTAMSVMTLQVYYRYENKYTSGKK